MCRRQEVSARDKLFRMEEHIFIVIQPNKTNFEKIERALLKFSLLLFVLV